MPAGKRETIVADPPMDTWQRLLLTELPARRLEVLRLPSLTRLECSAGQLEALPYEDLPSLSYLEAIGCQFAAFEAYRLGQLASLYLSYSGQLQSIDAHGLGHLQDLGAENCVQLGEVDVAGCPVLTTLYLCNGNLTPPAVDRILADLVTNGAGNGFCDLSSGPGLNDPPSAEGEASKVILAARGWTVLTM